MPGADRHIPHLHLPGPWTGEELALAEGQRRHLERVLRLGDGSPVTYTDGKGADGSGHLTKGAVVRGPEVTGRARSELTVAVAPPADKNRARFLVEKLAEIGVARLVWVRTRRTEGHPPPPSKSQAWVESALEQSRGTWLMEVSAGPVAALTRPLVVADPSGAATWPDECASVLVGPEGGFEEAEIPEDAGRVSLGPTVLRVETAAVVAAALALTGR